MGKFIRHNLKIYNSPIRFAILVILIVALVTAASWGITLLFTYLISLFWAGTVLAFDWSVPFATGIWLVLLLIGGFTSARVNFND